MRLYGKNYGIAYQIRDDILDLEASGNDLKPDVNKFRATLPLIHAYESANKEKQVLLESLLSEKTQESLSAFINELQVNLENSSLSYCARKMDEYIDRALESLAPLKKTIFKSYLKEMAELLRIKSPKINAQNIIYQT